MTTEEALNHPLSKEIYNITLEICQIINIIGSIYKKPIQDRSLLLASKVAGGAVADDDNNDECKLSLMFFKVAEKAAEDLKGLLVNVIYEESHKEGFEDEYRILKNSLKELDAFKIKIGLQVEHIQSNLPY